jgi:uncharacterized protein YndB with AHSA1/START domain
MAGQVTVTREIQAPAQRVWGLVADVTRMGEWSPENTGATWLPGVKGPQPGARFVGTNRNGWRRWWTIATITDSDPGRVLRFRVTAPVLKVAEWGYAFEATPAGCRVTESWTDLRGRLFKQVSERVSGVRDRAERNRTNMEHTLDRIKAAMEPSSDSAGAGSPG